MRKLFFNTKMTWLRVIIFAIAAAILTAALLIIPFTRDTSLSYIGVYPECWILFALIIIMNCEKPLEAGLKTLVFFLISQPLIYLLQVPFSSLGWELFGYYPRWFIATLLCFPGAMIAWFVKKDNVLSALILSVATAFLAAESMYFYNGFLKAPPHGIFAAVFCAALAVVLIFVLLKNALGRIIACVITLLAAVAMCVFLNLGGSGSSVSYALEPGHEWELTESGGDYVGDVTVDGETLSVTAENYGKMEVTVVNEDGEEIILVIENDKSNGITVTEK